MKTIPFFTNHRAAPTPDARLRPLQRLRGWLAVGLAGAACMLPARAQTTTQMIDMHSGWNAIWVEVEPTNNALGAVFAGLPVEVVWAYFEKSSPADFIQDLNELPWNNPSWRRYFPPPNPKAVINNLFTVNANRAYLVKATNACTLILTGQPSVRPVPWLPDSLNLRGFPVDPENLPTFDDYLAPAQAHAGQPVYRLQPEGLWELVAGYSVDANGFPQPVPGTEPVRSGEAYWVYCAGHSDYVAPLSLEVEGGDGLDYGYSLATLMIRASNGTDSDRAVFLTSLTADEVPLSYYDLDAPQGSRWVVFPGYYKKLLAAGETWSQRLSIRRTDIVSEHYGTVLQVTDGAGTRHLLPVRADKPLSGGAGGAGATGSIEDHTGLWIGHATINAVSEAHGLAAEPTATADATGNGSEFNLRLLLHVEPNGTTRLLKQVIQMWQDGTYTNDASGYRKVDQPGRYVLLTDDARIMEFQGATLRDGESVGRRISCAGLDFPDEDPRHPGTRRMTGQFARNGSLTNRFTLGQDFPTNPFKHQYHPDHPTGREITRTLQLQFDENPPPDLSEPAYGDTVLAGTYRESLEGLHQRTLVVSGNFQLRRISQIGELNPINP